MADFKRDLQRGKYYEHKALKTLSNYKFKDLHIFEGYKKEYDIEGVYKKKKVYIEVKYSKYVSYSNSIFVEVFTTKFKESGLTATRSDYYIMYGYFRYWIIKTEKLKKALEKHLRNTIMIKNPTQFQLIDYIKESGTYTKNTVGVIIPISIIEKYSKWTGIHNKKKPKTETKPNIKNMFI
jgi:hypothetical protein